MDILILKKTGRDFFLQSASTSEGSLDVRKMGHFLGPAFEESMTTAVHTGSDRLLWRQQAHFPTEM
ncbi:hypothetical protein VULLAG_LOCUS15797 [Vulpes lagopus]